MEDRGESEEAAAEIEADRRRKEIADEDRTVSTEKSRPFLLELLQRQKFFCIVVDYIFSVC